MAAARKTTKKRKPAKKLERLEPSGIIFRYGVRCARVFGNSLEIGSYSKDYGFCMDEAFCKLGTVDAFFAVEAALKEAGWIK